jgi:hypothetical protein
MVLNTKNAWDGMVNSTAFCSELNVKALPSSVANPDADIYGFLLRMADLLNHILPWFHKVEIIITSAEDRTRFTNLFGVFMKLGDLWPCSINGHIDGPLNYYSHNSKKPDSKRGGGINITQRHLISIISVSKTALSTPYAKDNHRIHDGIQATITGCEKKLTIMIQNLNQHMNISNTKSDIGELIFLNKLTSCDSLQYCKFYSDPTKKVHRIHEAVASALCLLEEYEYLEFSNYEPDDIVERDYFFRIPMNFGRRAIVLKKSMGGQRRDISFLILLPISTNDPAFPQKTVEVRREIEMKIPLFLSRNTKKDFYDIMSVPKTIGDKRGERLAMLMITGDKSASRNLEQQKKDIEFATFLAEGMSEYLFLDLMRENKTWTETGTTAFTIFYNTAEKILDKSVANAADRRRSNIVDVDTSLSSIADLYRKVVIEFEIENPYEDTRPPVPCPSLFEKQFMPPDEHNFLAKRFYSRFYFRLRKSKSNIHKRHKDFLFCKEQMLLHRGMAIHNKQSSLYFILDDKQKVQISEEGNPILCAPSARRTLHCEDGKKVILWMNMMNLNKKQNAIKCIHNVVNHYINMIF